MEANTGVSVEAMSRARFVIMSRAPSPAVNPITLLSLSSPSVAEGDVGTVILRYVLSRGADGYGLPIQFAARSTAVGTATPDVDFYPFALSGAIAQGQSIDLDAIVIGDTAPEPDETIQMQVTAAWP